MEQNQWIHSSSRAKNTAIKDTGSRYRCYSGDRPPHRVRKPWSDSYMHLICSALLQSSYFYFLITPHLHLHPSTTESSLFPSSDKHWLFSGAKQGVIKNVFLFTTWMLKTDCAPYSLLSSKLKSSIWLVEASLSNFRLQASNCDHEMTSRLFLPARRQSLSPTKTLVQLSNYFCFHLIKTCSLSSLKFKASLFLDIANVDTASKCA